MHAGPCSQKPALLAIYIEFFVLKVAVSGWYIVYYMCIVEYNNILCRYNTVWKGCDDICDGPF